ncbi:MAG: nucleotidyltransferase [Candidatus Tenebribacter davisii]|nr:nucleotidyltransferase [Candidatus Tenebribacter davisii]
METRNNILSQIAQHLDISPSDFKKAQERYSAVRSWLDDGSYKSGSLPDIYLQGSFRLGTVVRPYRDGKDADFDIDQVCELKQRHEPILPQTLKHDIGDRLNANITYRRMLDDEGRRCWTLQYASEEGNPGFHIDVLPAVININGRFGEIDITDKESQTYSWSSSNPKGYYRWFKSKNAFSDDFDREQRESIFESHANLYRDVSEVPKQLIRSSLQRSIQIMKRHRDIYFTDRDHKPISIIITTICSHLYKGEGIIETIKRFAYYIIKRHNIIMGGSDPKPDSILDYIDGNWIIPNPVDQDKPKDEVENFSDKWNQEPKLSMAFFEWIYQLSRDMRGFELSGLSDDLSMRIKSFGDGSSYPNILAHTLREHPNVEAINFTSQLLDLIHLGIEGKLDWKIIEEIATRNVKEFPEGENRDIARVNYYQTIRHQGLILPYVAKQNIRRILEERAYKPNFVFCGNLLLGTATRKMLQDIIRNDNYENDVMAWPIVRLGKPELFVPPTPTRV